MRHQTKQSYTTAFNILKTFVGDRKILDFELVAIQAIQDVLPRTQISGCYFHYVKAIKLKLRKMKKKKLISRDSFIKCGKSYLGCLAFMPPHAVKRAYWSIVCPYFLQRPREGINVTQYLERTWLKRFQPVTWICYFRMLHSWGFTTKKI